MTTDAAADTALPDLENVARSELGETAETRERCLSQLRQLIDADTSLLWPTDEKFLVKYLRCRKYNVELAFNAMRKYFRVRQNSPEFFKALTPYTASYENVILDNHLIMISKHRDPMGRAVAMMKLGAWNTSICPVTDLVRAALVMAEWTLLNEETQIRGVVGVFDLKGLSISHLAHFTPFLLGKLAHIVQDCYPARLKAVYVTNNSPIFELLFAAVKPFLKSKLLRRFRFLGCDPSTFHGLLPPDCIPAEFGGTHEDFDYSSQHMDVASTSDYFEYVNRFGYGK
ncbi:alpha-tocopherol transfer protein-like isoform X1 [Dermacentor variabilis]|uniref:alpha-tocopherol transfer protein-like isoform X1 n=1 Tax=Dermacentor variabilis TaxID=34621 RepID=UPI003F5C3EE2